MSFSATRLTCFAILSAIEEDLRSEAETHLPDGDVSTLLASERLARIQERRSKDHPGATTASLGALLPYVDFQDAYEILMRRKAELPSDLYEQLKEFSERLARLTGVRNRVAHTRPMEIDDLPNVLDLARALCDAPGTRWPTVRATLARLEREPAYVLGLSVALPSDPDLAPQHNLPVPDFDETGFFGRRQELTRIKKAIKGPYPVVSILGDGGIGKTSIALKAAYDLLDDPDVKFDVIVWVSAKATILTLNEIKHISNAIQDSLGLFAAAAKELGAPLSEGVDPVKELLDSLEAFKVLLILDNLETVLDARLRSFLLELPLGSKVLITSRIGLGIENPVNLDPLNADDSARLLRALARTRDVKVINTMDVGTINRLVTQLKGHPAYIRWLVAGVQSGRRPSDLVSRNSLVLDFCMSNVYDRLPVGARNVLRSMQVLQGPRSQAELAYLNEVTATAIQAALLDLMTTNFVSMMSQSNRQALETTYQISEFAKQYLDKQHPVTSEERNWLLERNRRLVEMGASLRAAGSADPYSPETVDIRGTEDFHVAKLLRDAINAAANGKTNKALDNCHEAQLLAPTYHEAWRVEAFIQSLRPDVASALAAYERAIELAPESPSLKYFFGTFLLYEGGDQRNALALLQSAANLDRDRVEILLQIASAHMLLGDFDASIETASHILRRGPIAARDGAIAVLIGLKSASYAARTAEEKGDLTAAVGYVELATELAEVASIELLAGEPSDRILQLHDVAMKLAADLDDNFFVSKAREYGARILDRLRVLDADLLERRIGRVKAIVWDKYYGFVTCRGKDYFFHYRDLANEEDWNHLREGSAMALRPMRSHAKGPKAVDPRLLD